MIKQFQVRAIGSVAVYNMEGGRCIALYSSDKSIVIPQKGDIIKLDDKPYVIDTRRFTFKANYLETFDQTVELFVKPL